MRLTEMPSSLARWLAVGSKPTAARCLARPSHSPSTRQYTRGAVEVGAPPLTPRAPPIALLLQPGAAREAAAGTEPIVGAELPAAGAGDENARVPPPRCRIASRLAMMIRGTNLRASAGEFGRVYKIGRVITNPNGLQWLSGSKHMWLSRYFPEGLSCCTFEEPRCF